MTSYSVPRQLNNTVHKNRNIWLLTLKSTFISEISRDIEIWDYFSYKLILLKTL